MMEVLNNRRSAIGWCSTCRDRRGPFVYMESGKHYCRPCSQEIREVMRVLAAGRRHDDLTTN